MELKQNPFSFYDFLGYFTPGAIFIYGFMAITSHSGILTLDFTESFSVQFYVPFVLGSYALGHLLSFISSVLIEKYTIWLIGYPSKYLLGIKAESYLSHNWFIRLAVLLFLLPVSLFECFLNFTLKYRQTFSKSLDVFLQK